MHRSIDMHPRRLILPILATALIFLAAPALAGPVVAPGQKLYLIKTEHFDIIFPEASRPSALRLFAMAESVYDEVAGKLASRLPTRVPVVITPDIGTFNGYSSLVPYPHIVLYDTPIDIAWTSFRDNLRGLFLHELTHAVSLQVKAPWASFFSGIFGSWVAPSLINAPEFMVEGVTVSFESADGVTGRASDPLVKERIRQDILEGRFKTPLEASGLYDEYPGGEIFYEYGGLFNAYLQRTYGMEKYAELWKAMGNLVLAFSLDRYNVGFYAAFRRTYGIPFLESWAEFRDSLAISGVALPPEALWPDDLASLKGGLAGNAGELFWTDARGRRAMAMDARTLEAKPLFDVDGKTAISDASPDASSGSKASGRLLVSRALDLPDGRDETETIVYDLAAGRFLPETRVARLREARFFREGFVGIASNLHNTDLVYTSRSSSKILIRGSETVMFASPAVLDDDRIALIVSIEGRRHIGILEVDEGRLSLVRPEGGDAELFAYVRSLSVSGDRGSRRLWFNYDSDDRLYKLGLLDGEDIRVEATDYSGGVLYPREAAGRVFYVGRFSEGDRICRYPGDSPSPLSRRVAYSLEPFDSEGPRAESEALSDAAGASAVIGAYRPLAYANPLKMWIPFVDPTTLGRSFRPFCLFVLEDPIDTNAMDIVAGYDSAHRFGDVSIAWTNGALPVALSGDIGDRLVYDSTEYPERQSSASLSATLPLPVFPEPREAALGIGGEVFDRARETEGSPYGWEYQGWRATASALAAWYGRLPGVRASTARGIDLVSYYDLDTESRARKIEAHLVASYDRLPIRLDLWGAWASEAILEVDASSEVFTSDRRPPYFEYATLRDSSSDFLAEGTLAYRVADRAIHSRIHGLYFNRLLVDLGLRGAYFRDEFLSSSFARLSFDLGAAFGSLPIAARLFGEGFARFNVSPSEGIVGWRLGMQFDSDSGTPVARGTFPERRGRD